CIRDFLSERFSDLCVGSGIYGACAVVQDQYFRFRQKRPGDTEPLLLTSGNIASALFDMRIAAIRHSLNKLIRTGKTAGTAALFLRRVFVSPAEVVQDTSGKQDILLQYDRHFITKHFHIVASDILSAHLDTSGSYIIKTADQIDQTGLCASGSSDNTDRLTGTDGQIDILEHRLFAVFLISKIHMIENDASIGNFHHRMFRIGKIALLIEHFRHTSCTGDTHGNHNKYHRQHHQTHQDIHTVSKKAHQLSRGHGGADNHLRTQPADQQDTSV